MKSITEILPDNITSFKKKIKKNSPDKKTVIYFTNNEEKNLQISNEYSVSKNPKISKILKQITATKFEPTNTNENQNSISRQKTKESVSHNLNTNEDANVLSQDKAKFNTNFSETIMLFKDKANEMNIKNMKTDEFNNFVNYSDKYFNLGQFDNFSIFNSYETIMNNNQKLDFFADSNVSFKNTFLRNMKNKTDFKNMNLIKNSFSQSTINIPNVDSDDENVNVNNENKNNEELQNSGKNIQRNSESKNSKKTKLTPQTKISKQTKKSNFKSNTFYSQSINKNLNPIKNQPNHIFDLIDEETYNEDIQKYRTLNQMILKHLNREEFISFASEKKKAEKFRNNLEVSINSSKLFSKPTTQIRFNNENLIEKNNLYPITSENANENATATISATEHRYTEKINEDYYKAENKLTEKGVGDYKIFTEITEDKKEEQEDKEEQIKYVDYGINTNESVFTMENNISQGKDNEKYIAIGSKNSNFFNKIESSNQKSKNFSPFKSSTKEKIFRKSNEKSKDELEMKRILWEKLQKKANFDDSKNSLFKTKTMKIDNNRISQVKKRKITVEEREILNKTKSKTKSPTRRERERENLVIKEKENLGGGLITLNNDVKTSNSIFDKLEKKGIFKIKKNDANDFSYNNKNLVKSIPDVYFNRKSI